MLQRFNHRIKSSVGKRMLTVTFTHMIHDILCSSWHMKTLTIFIKTYMCTEVLYKIFKTRLHSVFSIGTNNVKVWPSLCLIHVGCISSQGIVGWSMYSCHLFFLQWIDHKRSVIGIHFFCILLLFRTRSFDFKVLLNNFFLTSKSSIMVKILSGIVISTFSHVASPVTIFLKKSMKILISVQWLLKWQVH